MERLAVLLLIGIIVTIVVFVLVNRPRPGPPSPVGPRWYWPKELPWPGPQPKTIEGFKTLFNTSGIAIHMLSPDWIKAFVWQDLTNFTLDADCDINCAAYSFLHASLPVVIISFSNVYYQFALAYDAYGIWDNVTCMSAIDANTDSRNCCGCTYSIESCVDNRLGYWDNDGHQPFQSPYCPNRQQKDNTACGMNETCKALNSGCGPNVTTLVDAQICTTDQIYEGSCQECYRPDWCDLKGITSVQEWMDRFSDGWQATHTAQCRFHQTQVKLWWDTMQVFYGKLKTEASVPYELVVLENEINLYFNANQPDYERVHKTMMDNLQAIIYLPNNKDPQSADDPNLKQAVCSLQKHLDTLGLHVPILSFNVERPRSLAMWDPKTLVDLSNPMYNIQEVNCSG